MHTASLGVLAAAMVAATALAQTGTKNWTAPKTPWGDPDLQGSWTSDDQRGVPFERPLSSERARLSPSRNWPTGSKRTA